MFVEKSKKQSYISSGKWRLKISHIDVSFSYKDGIAKSIHDHLTPTAERLDQIAQDKVLKF